MKSNMFRRTSEDQQTSQADDKKSDDELYDDAIDKDTADYYERSRKNKIEIQRLDIWIAVGLYLVSSSIALALLF
jgi:hypothetical protein